MKNLYYRCVFAPILATFFLSINVFSQDIDVTVGTPSAASICGPLIELEVTIANNTALDAFDLEGAFTAIPGLVLEQVDPPASLNGNSVELGDLLIGEELTFTAFFQLACDYTDADLEIEFSLINGGTGSNISSSAQVVEADLSIPSTNPSVLGVFLGLETSVTANVVNNGFGSLDQLTYCVSNTLTNLQLQGIFVGGLDITLGGPDPDASTATQNCYTINSAALQAAGLGETLDQGETVMPEERWLVIECVDDPDDIIRRAQYGCQGDTDCQDKSQSDFGATGVSYDLLAPEIDVEVASTIRPACYVDDPTVVEMRLTNNGTAPAKDIRFRIFTDGNGGRGMTLNTASVNATFESDNTVFGTPNFLLETAANDCRAPGIRDARMELEDVNLAVGESLIIRYELNASCDCNNCDIRNKYWHRFRLEAYDNPCDDELIDEQNTDPTGRFDAFIQGFPEIQPTLNANEEACVSFFVTNAQLDWLNGNYPNSYLEATFDIPCGLDYVPGSVQWTDRDGMAFNIDPANITSAEDVDGDDNDQLTVRFTPSGRPAGFDYGAGMNFQYCVVVDCSEKPEPVCGASFFEVEIDAQFDFTTDPTCAAPCAIQKIKDPEPIETRLICPPTVVGCECDGIQFNNLVIERANFGIGDSNNDQIPDGNLDLNKVQRDRFLQGDSIRVLLEGTVGDVDDDRDFNYGYVTYPIEHVNFTPLGVTLTINDADGGTISCMAVPITPDMVNNRIIIDYSVPTLSGFGCLPANFLYGDGDAISIEFFYVEKDLTDEQFVIRDYQPSFYLSEDPFEMGPIYQCNPRIGRLTQVGFNTEFNFSNDNFGACEQPNWTIHYDRQIGGAGADEFPCEIRPIGLPSRLVFNKPSNFNHRIDSWDVVIQQRIPPSNNIVDTRPLTSPSIPAQFFLLNGDEVTFLIANYLESLGLAEIPPDEGYRVFLYPRIQGSCESVAQMNIPYSFQLFEEVDENIFCTTELSRQPETRNFNYLGAAEIDLRTDVNEIRLCSGNDVATVRVSNTKPPAASFSFLYAEPTGGVIITRIEDANTGNEIMPNPFGIYELGTIGGNRERELNVFFTKNTCDVEQLDFVAGWDCEGYPTTINDALCTDPSTIRLTSARSNVDMVVREPAPQTTAIIDLCDPVPYELDILSTDLGFVRDLFLSIELPPNQVYVPGSFEISIPSPALGGSFTSAIDPTPVGGNRFEIDIAALDPILNTEGLIGSKDPSNSVITVRFTAETECGYLSGSRARFILESKNSCGDPLRPRRRRSGRVCLRPDESTLDVVVTPNNLSLDACANEQTTTGIDISVIAGEISNIDSVRITLPAGIDYVSGSYMPGTNAPGGNNPDEIRTVSGQTILLWPLQVGLGPGEMVDFDIAIQASDVGQPCTDYDLLVEAFTTFEASCKGEICEVAELSGEGIQSIQILKPSLDFNFVSGTIALDGTTGQATADIEVQVTNFGNPLTAGNTITVDIFEDANGNGTYDPGVDVFLFDITETLTQDLGTGQSITISGLESFPAGEVCTVIGLLDPDNTCTCNEVPSLNFRPEIIYDIPTEYDLCSGDVLSIGGMNIPGYTFEWLPLNGSDLGALSATNQSMVDFTAPPNNTGMPVTVSYLLRAANAPCFVDNVVNITIQPIVMDMVSINACLGASVDLPTISDEGASNFVWTSAGGSPITTNGRFATVDNVSASETYTLTYDLGTGGCPAQYIVKLNAVDCGTANTALGNFVWFDFDGDGEQDSGEPGIAGVTVNLIDANTGTVIGTTVTDGTGFYLFDMLPAGNYAVEFLPLPGFTFTGQDNIADDALDSDADPATGRTVGMFLPLNEQDLTIDAGFIPDCNLEIELTIGDCMIDGTDLVRRLTIEATWDGNPYTYDQFGDGMDVIEFDLNGEMLTFSVDDLSGNAIILDRLLASSDTGPWTVTAAFKEASTCGSTDTEAALPACEFDLALTKMPSTLMPTPGPYSYGDMICMDIAVINQGALPVDNVQIFDQLPPGFAFDAANSPGWFDNDPLQLFIFPDPIGPGETAVATLCVTLVMTNGGEDDYTNLAEINSFTNLAGEDRSDFDEDSTPDMDFTNDAGGDPDNDSNDAINGDGSGNPGDDNAATDEDDHDPFKVEVQDLALVKRLTTMPFFSIPQSVTYTIDVINQGNVSAQQIEVIDYIPAGFTYSQADNPDWGPLTGANTASITIAGPLEPGQTESVNITLQLTGVTGQFNYVNEAEIASALDPDNMPFDDIDGTLDDVPGNDAGGTPLAESDDAVDGDGTGNPGDTDGSTDEDNADPALLSIDSVAVGSTVFIDFADNGIQDGADVPVADVLVELLIDANGNMMIDPGEETPIASTFTDAMGNYYFGELFPANYVVQIPSVNFANGIALADFASSSTFSATTDDNLDGNDDGSQPGGAFTDVRSPVFRLFPGMEVLAGDETFQGGGQDLANGQDDENGNMTIDFGFLPNVALGSTVFADFDDSGFQDGGEPGIADVLIYVLFDVNDNGVIDPAEQMPYDSTITDVNGDYIFAGLPPGNYIVQIPTTQFLADSSLQFLPMSSTDIGTTGADNQTDGDDNGLQLGGSGTVVESPLINLQPGQEPIDGVGETEQGADEDDGFDISGDMTIDFGFICNLEIELTNGLIDLCGIKKLDLSSLVVSITPDLPAFWDTSGDGMFVDADGNEVDPASYADAVFYMPGTADVNSGQLTITLESDLEGPCLPVSDSVVVEVKKVGCGNFFWDGQ